MVYLVELNTDPMNLFFKRAFPVIPLLLLALSSLLAGSRPAPGAVDDSLKALIRKYEAVGLSVAVVKKGRITYTGAFGKKDLEKDENLTGESLFRIASISKSFTATAIMQLAEAGKLRLEDDVSDLIGFRVRNPAYPDEVITLKMLLSHTSGLNDSQGYFTLDVINPARNDSASKCYNSYRPGADYQYCNLNFNIAGTIVERVSGERFDRYVYHHILEPLGLYGGYCVDSLDKTRFATLYEYDKETRKMTAAPMAYHPRSEEIRNYAAGYSTPVFSPTGGMKISAPDLARYMTMHMYRGKSKRKRIISENSARLMQTPVENGQGYGLALWVSDKLVPGVTLTGHTGSAYGLYSIMVFDPEKKYGIVAITNGCNPVYSNGYNEFLASVVNLLYRRVITN